LGVDEKMSDMNLIQEIEEIFKRFYTHLSPNLNALVATDLTKIYFDHRNIKQSGKPDYEGIYQKLNRDIQPEPKLKAIAECIKIYEEDRQRIGNKENHIDFYLDIAERCICAIKQELEDQQ
jgi:hypothetical protein